MQRRFESEVYTSAVSALGTPFVCWACGVSESDLHGALRGDRELAPGQGAALDELTAVALLALARQEADQLPLIFHLDPLSVYSEGHGMSFTNALRVASGAPVSIPEIDDPVGRPLAALAVDLYPALLLPAEEAWPSDRSPASFFQHPQRQIFADAVVADPSLSLLFPVHSDTSGHQGAYFSTSGRGGTIQIWGFHDTLLMSAWREARLRDVIPTLDAFSECVQATLACVRELASGQEVEVRALVGVSGFVLPEGTHIDLEWGVLRPSRDQDMAFAPSSLQHQVEGDGTTVSYAGDVVLETTLPYSLHVEPELAWDSPAEDKLVMTTQHELQRRIDHLSLGAALAPESHQHFVKATWRAIFEPVSFGLALSWLDPRQGRTFMPHQLTHAEALCWKDWSERAHEHCGAQVQIALRRTLSSIAIRRDSVDSLIDAVTAWENLFGSGAGELTLRISASIAWLLGDTTEQRREIQSEVRGIYNRRSKVLHGDFDPSGDAETAAMAETAIGLTLALWRTLLTDRTDLLDEVRQSSERSARLLMGG